MLVGEDFEIRAEDQPDNTKYHPLILQDTFYSRITTIINKIEPEKKFYYLQNLLSSFEDALKCDTCSAVLEVGCISFRCNHKFCKKCSNKKSTCSLCVNPGYDASCQLTRNFSFLLKDITVMRSEYNAESVVFNLIRFLMDPVGTSVKGDPNSKPLHPVTKSNSSTSPALTTAPKKPAIKRTMQKSNKSDSFKRKFQSSSPRTPECDSDALFVDFKTETTKFKGSTHSYLQQQESILSPKFDQNIKTYSKNAKRKLPCTDINEDSTSEEIRLKKQKEHNNDGNTVNTLPLKKNENRKNFLCIEGHSEAKESPTCVSSVKKNRQKLSRKSNENVTDSSLKGTFIGFEQISVTERYNKLKSVRDHYANFCAKLLPSNVIDDGLDGIQENVTDEDGSKINKRASKRSCRYENERSNEEYAIKGMPNVGSTKIIEKPISESRDEDVRVDEKLASKENLGKQGITLEGIKVPVHDWKMVSEKSEKDINVNCMGKSEEKVLKDILEKQIITESNEILDRKKHDEENSEIDHRMKKENLDANKSDYDTEDVVDITSKLWERNNRQTRKKKTLFKSLQERKKKNVLLKLLEEKKLQKEKENRDLSIIKSNRGVILDAVVEENKLLLPAGNTIHKELKEKISIEQKTPLEDHINLIQTSSCNTQYNGKWSAENSSNTIITSETEALPYDPANTERLLLNNNANKSTTDETKILSHDAEQPSLKSSPQSSPEVTKEKSSEVEYYVQRMSTKISDELTLSTNENSAERFPSKSICNSKSFPEETKTFSSDLNCVEQASPKVSPRSVLEETTESLSKPICSQWKSENTSEKSLKTESEVKLEETLMPLLKESKFYSPRPSRCTVSSPVPNLDVQSIHGFPNTSTPVAKNEKANRSREEEKENNEVELSLENDRTLKLIGDFVSNSNNFSQDEIASREDSSYKLTIKRKCTNLKRTINNQNQKSIVNLKKNFCITSPQSLLVERSKTTRNSANGYGAQNGSHQDEGRYEAGNLMNSVESNSSHTSNVSNSLTTKEVACQTSSDLHLALLMQEYPHLFQRSSLPLSVYDSPAQSDMKSNDRTLSAVRTPEHLSRDCGTYGKFTTVSSITTSEKKHAEAEFASHSILCDSLRTPLNFHSKNNSPADISSISLLPSSEKKVSEFLTSNLDRRRLGVRLNFQNDMNVRSKNDLVESPSTGLVLNDDEILCSKDIISCTDDSFIYFSNMKSSVVGKLFPSPCDADKTDEKESGLSNGSEELKFTDTKADDEKAGRVEEKIFNSEKDEKTVLTSDPDFIPDSAVQVQDDVEIFIDEETYRNRDMDDHETPKKQNSDDEDIDFIAATPTCGDERAIESSIEKVQSQKSLSTFNEVDTLDEKSHPLFNTNQYQTPEPAKMIHENVNLSNSEAVTYSSSKSISKSLYFSNMRSMANKKLISFSTSGLKDADCYLVKAFCEKFPVIMQEKLSVESTHLIVKTDSENQASRTFKYLQAIVSNLIIVSVNWVAECLQHGYIVNEEKFIPLDSSSECGPLRAYNVARGLTPSPLSWLRDYCVLFKEPIPQGCTLPQLQDIVKKTGAVVVNSLEEMSMYPRHHHVIIISDDDEDTGDITKHIKHWLLKYQAVAIEFNWLLEIIGRNRLVPFCDHEFAEIPQDILIKFKFPDEMLN